MEYIEGKVNFLVKKFESTCPFEISKGLGIQIQFEFLGNIYGYFSKHFRIPIIHINETSEERQQLFTCAHELGHAVLHPNENTSFLKSNTFQSSSKIETEANTFAVYLLSKQSQSITVCEATEIYKIPETHLKFF